MINSTTDILLQYERPDQRQQIVQLGPIPADRLVDGNLFPMILLQ